MASESWSAFTLQATKSCAVEAATCLADEMSFSSLAWPCTAALAASHRLLVAAATMRACSKRGCQRGYGSLPWGGYALTGPKEVVGHEKVTTSFHAMSQLVGEGARSTAASLTEEKHKGRASSSFQQEPGGGSPPPPEHDPDTHS